MSSIIRCCCAISFLMVAACAPRAPESPRQPSPEARNAETEKKPRKQRPPVVAPPPAYGNKIVRGEVQLGDAASAARARRL
jgi:hypothetical protein